MSYEQDRALAHALAYNRKVRHTNLAMCAATSLDTTLDQKVESFKVALAIWPKGSFEYQNIVKQCPDLLGVVAIDTAYVSSKEFA
jgi:hypothetical protein